MEHIPHCSQQLEASKHLVKEMRDRLLQGERQLGQTAPLQGWPAGIAACASLEDGTGDHHTPGTIPPKSTAAPKGLQGHKAVGWDT